MPGTMPPRRKITLVRWDGRTVRLVEMRQCILFWPQVGVTRDGALRHFAEGLLHRDLGEVASAEGDALQYIPELLGCGEP